MCILVLSLPFMAACTDNDDMPETNALVPVQFSAYEMVQTRAATATYVSQSTFRYRSRVGVFSYYTGNASWSISHKPNFMFNQMVEKQAADWAYSPLKYWPNQQDDKLTFYAYYPHGAAGLSVVSSNATAGLPLFRLNVQQYSTDQADFMLSEIEPDETHVTSMSTTSVDYQVQLRFKHALSKVVLRVVDEMDDPLTFTATLSGWYDQGDCCSSTSEVVNWSNLVAGGTVFSTEGATTADERILLMIPGNLRSPGMNPTLRFNYVYQGVPFTSDAYALNATGTSTPDDDTDDLTQWLPGKTYTYTLHITHEGNDLSVTVNPWYQAGMVFGN